MWKLKWGEFGQSTNRAKNSKISTKHTVFPVKIFFRFFIFFRNLKSYRFSNYQFDREEIKKRPFFSKDVLPIELQKNLWSFLLKMTFIIFFIFFSWHWHNIYFWFYNWRLTLFIWHFTFVILHFCISHFSLIFVRNGQLFHVRRIWLVAKVDCLMAG